MFRPSVCVQAPTRSQPSLRGGNTLFKDKEPKVRNRKEHIMNTHTHSSPDIPKWSTLLIEAVTRPGLIMEAYSAFHQYSIGNQLLALVQCQMRYVE
jgi:hypothetical protein